MVWRAIVWLILVTPGWHTGDLAKPQLGLSDGVWRELAASVDTILHNGALVNHAFSYEQLFEPNVLGSVEVLPADLAAHLAWCSACVVVCYSEPLAGTL